MKDQLESIGIWIDVLALNIQEGNTFRLEYAQKKLFALGVDVTLSEGVKESIRDIGSKRKVGKP